VPSHDPLGNLGCGPSPQGEPKREGIHFPDSFDRAQFRDSMFVLHDLVFELRQEVAELHFRIQAMDVKVASFLQILLSMHAALYPYPVEAIPMEDPEADKDEGQNNVSSPAKINKKKEVREDDTEEAAHNEEDSK
jgi:hypothetical protein